MNALSNWLTSNEFERSTGVSTSSSVAINVRSSPYNAAGDGATDDTAAIQAAINAVNAAGGGIVQVPQGTFACASQITLKNGVWLVGINQELGAAATGSVIKFTGAGTSGGFVGAGTGGVRISNLYIYSSNVAFTGILINMDRGAAPSDTANFNIVDNVLGSTTDTSSILLALDKCIEGEVRGNLFGGGVKQIRGMTTGTYSNRISIGPNNAFGGYTTAAIADPATSWAIKGNTFEPGAAGIQKCVMDTLHGGQALNFSNNWIGDSTANNQIFIELGANGCIANSNAISAFAGTGNTAFKFTGNVIGASFRGNNIGTNPQTAFDFNGAVGTLTNGITIEDNVISSATITTGIRANTARRITLNRTSNGVLIPDWTTYAPSQSATTGTWTGGSVNYARYFRDGQMMTVQIDIEASSVSVTPAQLQTTIPDGATAAGRMFQPLTCTDNSVAKTGSVFVNNNTLISMTPAPFASGAWSASGAATSVSFSITFEVT